MTPKKVGTATITVTSKANKKVQAKYKVTVKKNDMVLAVGFDMYDNIKYYVKKNDDGTVEKQWVPLNREMFSATKNVATANSDDIGFTVTSSNENVLKINADDDLEVRGKGS